MEPDCKELTWEKKLHTHILGSKNKKQSNPYSRSDPCSRSDREEATAQPPPAPVAAAKSPQPALPLLISSAMCVVHEVHVPPMMGKGAGALELSIAEAGWVAAPRSSSSPEFGVVRRRIPVVGPHGGVATACEHDGLVHELVGASAPRPPARRARGTAATTSCSACPW